VQLRPQPTVAKVFIDDYAIKFAKENFFTIFTSACLYQIRTLNLRVASQVLYHFANEGQPAKYP